MQAYMRNLLYSKYIYFIHKCKFIYKKKRKKEKQKTKKIK